MSLVSQILDQTRRVASVGRRLTVADLLPQRLAALTAATASEEIVVQLVVASSIRTVKDSR